MTRTKYHYWYWDEVPCLMRSTKHELASALGDIGRKWSNCGLIQELGLASSLLMMLSQMYRCLPAASLEESRQFAINFEVCCSHNDNILLFCNNCNDMSFVFLLLFFFTPITILVVNSSKVILMAEGTDMLHQNEMRCVLGIKESKFNEKNRSKFSHLLTVTAEVA